MGDPSLCKCSVDGTAPDNPDCPDHGEEIRQWMAWQRGEARCPYCIGQSDLDWLGMCDCDLAETTMVDR